MENFKKKHDPIPSFKWKGSIFFKNKNGYFKKKNFKNPEQINEYSFNISYRNYLKYKEKIDNFNKGQIINFKKFFFNRNNEKCTVLDLFCGCGGLSLGFQDAGFDVLLAIDNDFSACQTYAYNFKDSCILCLDLTEKEGNPSYIKNLLGIDNLYFDIIIGGPPCQGFSIVGRPKINSLIKEQIWEDSDLINDIKLNNGKHWFYNDRRNILYKKFLNYVAFFKPTVFLIENVPGMKSYQNGKIIEQIKQDFEEIKYSTQVEVLNSVNFKVPQKRNRLFFFGILCDSKYLAQIRNQNLESIREPQKNLIMYSKNKKNIFFPELFKFPNKTSKYIPLKIKKDVITVKDAFWDLNDLNEFGEAVEYPISNLKNSYLKLLRKNVSDNKIYNFSPRKTTKRDKKIYKFLDEGEKYKDLPNKISNYFYNKSYKESSDEIEILISKTIEKCMPYGDGKNFGDKFKRLKWDEPSWTIVAHLHKDGYMYIHPEKDRTISVREAARIQSFPDDFIFKSSRTNQFKHVGNAVPPLMSLVLALHIKEYIENQRHL